MELQELVERIQRWKARIASEEAGEIEVQSDDIVEDDSMDESAVLVADAVAQAEDIEEEAVAEEMYEEETGTVDEEEPQADEEDIQADEETLQADEEEVQLDAEAPSLDEDEVRVDEEEPPGDDYAAEQDIDIDVDVAVESEEATPDMTSEINIDDVEEI